MKILLYMIWGQIYVCVSVRVLGQRYTWVGLYIDTAKMFSDASSDLCSSPVMPENCNYCKSSLTLVLSGIFNCSHALVGI